MVDALLLPIMLLYFVSKPQDLPIGDNLQWGKGMGCCFALDDFGVGMSSFAYLKPLPVDYLKIDGSFIRNIVENLVDNAIVTAITHISSVMGIQTIAEFVENDAILERIMALGIDFAQGYRIAVPRPLG